MNKTIKTKLFLLSIATIASIGFLSCKKPAGEGGRATIKGKIYMQNYNSTFTVIIDENYAAGENVYITYGDNPAVANTTKSSHDGSFEFPYLRKGKYTVFAVSKDPNSNGLTGTIAIKKEVLINDKKDVINVGDILIIK